MKKSGILNPAIAQVVASLGHNDKLVIADAGLPIPAEVQRIDLALVANIPRFLDTLEALLLEMQVQEAIVADEIKTKSPQLYPEIVERLAGVPVRSVPHETFKELTHDAKAVVRTGEFTPYANIILVSGVVF